MKDGRISESRKTTFSRLLAVPAPIPTIKRKEGVCWVQRIPVKAGVLWVQKKK